MEDKVYAVIDTNVIVSAVISKHLESNPVKIFRAIVQERIVPLTKKSGRLVGLLLKIFANH